MSYQIPMKERIGDPRWIVIVLLLAAATTGLASATEINTAQDERKLAIGYLGPTEHDRDIETFNLDYSTQISRVGKNDIGKSTVLACRVKNRHGRRQVNE